MLQMFMALIDSVELQNKFEKIYFGHRKQMFYVAKQILQKDELAEDAVQEAFLSIAKKIEHIQDDNESMLKAYVLTIAKHAALYIQKGEQRNQYTVIDFEVPESEDGNPLESICLMAETISSLKNAIRQLPDIYQDVLMLKYVYEMDYDEIEELTHKSGATIRQQVSRGRKMLMDICKKEDLYAHV